MSIVIYPRDQVIFQRDSSDAINEEIALKCGPSNTIIYFDTASNVNSISSSFLYVTASNAVSASWAPGSSPGTILNTASLYYITSSWANNATSASWSPGSTPGTTLNTGSTYYITASSAVTASFALNASSGGGGTTLNTGSTYPITSSWAVAGGTQLATGSLVPITASQAVSASYPLFVLPATYTSSLFGTSSWANNSVASSFASTGPWGSNLITGSTVPITSSWAVSGGTQLATGSLVPITSSVSTTSSFANTFVRELTTGSTYQITSSQAVSASFAPGSSPATYTSSLFGTASWATNVVNQQTGSGTVLNTGSLYYITASWANTASQAISASFAPGGSTATYTSSLFGTASWANQSNTASWTWGTPTIVVTAPPYNANNHADVTGIDSTTAIQNAINTLSSSGYVGTVFFPAGWYQISGSITIPKRVMLAGESNFGINAYGSYLRRTSTTTASMFTVTNAGSFGMRNLSLDGALLSSQSVALNILSSSIWNIENCNFIQWGTAVYMRYSWIGRFHNCQLNYNTCSFDLQNQVNSNNIKDCHISANVTAISCSGDITLNCGMNNIEGSDFEGNVNSIVLSPAAWATNIRGNYFEGNTGNDIYLSGSLKTNIEANHFTGNDPINIWASQSLFTTIRDNNFYSFVSTHSLLNSNQYLQRYGNAYNDSNNVPIVFEKNTTFGFVNDAATSSFANLIQATSSWANNAVTSSFALTGPWGSNLITASLVPITASQAVSASFSPGGAAATYTSSLFGTASWATNTLTSSYDSQIAFGYVTDTTSSAQWITASFSSPNQVVLLSQTASYSFTQSNMPLVNQVSDLLLYVSHSAASGTSSLTFPASWKNIAGSWPTVMNNNTVAVMWLRAVDTNNIIGTWNPTLTASWATNAVTASTALTASQGTKCWGSVFNIGGTNYTSSTFGCSVSRTAAGTWPVVFNNSAGSSMYAVGINAFSGSTLHPTASACFAISQATTGFTMSFYTIGTANVLADFASCSFDVNSN
jgi:hypothetical protein